MVAATSPARTRRPFSDTLRAYLFNLPCLLIILALIAYPVGYSFWLSLHKYNLKRPAAEKFIWLRNYFSLVSDPEFLSSLKVTVSFAVVVLVVTLVFGLTLALVLNESFPGRGALRSLVLLPWAMPGVVNGLMWRTVFDAKTGPFNGVLYQLGLIDSYQGWLSTPTSAFVICAMTQVWNNLPFTVIVLLAGLSMIPSEQYDSARVDRAGIFQRFGHITLPWLLHPLLIVLILETMNAFRAFDAIYVLTGGGPGDATNVISMLNVKTIISYTDFGLGSAYSWVITLVSALIAVAYVGTLYRKGSFEV
ncbi:carbohydrate ABC transporter permease [Fodinicola acaciae]|uniref:carbohydrate ABC transporter permease n=1 Tax=Fodinicola acaciae TaxID=2681555 RepID=UPI0013D63673|nr:sugar ABC transporter permease [Fodinicola acaciae]